MSRRTAAFVAALALALPLVAYAQHAHFAVSQSKKAAPAGQKAAAAPKMTDAQKIKEAMSAAPAEIAKGATIMDWPATATGQPRQLRAGTNGWVCYPSSPTEFGAASVADPMCMDKAWQGWAEAWMSKKDPKTGQTGIAYMLRGDKGASNTDPFATGPTPNNQWVTSPPHIMVLYPDVKTLDAYPTDPKNGGPWVMWKGTPYAHLMVPVAPAKTATMAAR